MHCCGDEPQVHAAKARIRPSLGVLHSRLRKKSDPDRNKPRFRYLPWIGLKSSDAINKSRLPRVYKQVSGEALRTAQVPTIAALDGQSLGLTSKSY